MNDNLQTDTVEQTIEQLLSTVKELSALADKAINKVENDFTAVRMREELDVIMEKHNNQY